MKKKMIGRRVLAFICVVLMVLALPLSAFAVEDTPSEVMEARNGVLRIINVAKDGYMYTGSGFVVGTGGKVFIVTNYHVVEDAQQLYLFYNTGEYVKGTVYYEDETRDLAIVKAAKTIPDITPLQLETDEIDSGLAVYALGYPAAADYFVMTDEDEYEDFDELLGSVIADKQSMTITNGIISAIHNSSLIGDMSRSVKVLQTNAAINGGNSGGPLLNKSGRVVGINTMAITVADAMNGSVHVEELITVLRKAKVEYEGTPDPEAESEIVASSQAETQKSNGSPMTFLVIFFVVVLAGGALALALVLRGKKKPAVKGALSLDAFERSNRRVEEVAAFEMMRRFVESLMPLASYDLNPLFTAQNVVIGDDEVALANMTSDKKPGTPPDIMPGYSAPECYQGYAGPPATVYAIGGILYTLLTGRRPPEAPQRLAQNTPVFVNPTALQDLVNRAMEPYAQNRIPDVPSLREAMNAMADTVYAQNHNAY